MAPERKLRVGIDVGGTFTDVVAIDAATRRLVAARQSADDARGERRRCRRNRRRQSSVYCTNPASTSAEIAFIAHSTTQATNALLEGDLARVGVVGLTDGPPWLSRRAMRFAPLPLGSGARFEPVFAFASARDDGAMRACVDRLVAGKAEAIAASRSSGVDRPERESYGRRLRALVAGRCHQRSRRQRDLRPARADADGRA